MKECLLKHVQNHLVCRPLNLSELFLLKKKIEGFLNFNIEIYYFHEIGMDKLNQYFSEEYKKQYYRYEHAKISSEEFCLTVGEPANISIFELIT